MDQSSQLWILAGGNGAGKTTFYKKYLEKTGIPFVNADLIAQVTNPVSPEEASYLSANIAAAIREKLILQGISFCFETVFSHHSKVDFLAEAKTHGYKIILIYIHLDYSSLNEARVWQRSLEGGHNVPVEKIHSRIPRTIKNIKTALSIVDEAIILNNSSKKNPFQQIIVMKNGIFKKMVDPLPKWAEKLLSEIQFA